VKSLLEKKSVSRFLVFIGLCLSITIGQANAGLIPTGVGNVLLDVDTSGAEPSLLGARNIDVFGTGELYDVRFTSGGFLDIFVDESGLDARDESSARAFAQSLLDFVFLDLPIGVFDSNPGLTQGCANATLFSCSVFVPYSFGLLPSSNINIFNAVGLDNFASGLFVDSVVDAGFRPVDFVTSPFEFEVFADFSLSGAVPAQDVPEAPTIFLMAFAIFGIALVSRRAQN
jgi:hypothetical protein